MVQSDALLTLNMGIFCKYEEIWRYVPGLVFALAFIDRPVISTSMPRPWGFDLFRSSMATFWGLPTCATKTNFPLYTSVARSTPSTSSVVFLASALSFCDGSSLDAPTIIIPASHISSVYRDLLGKTVSHCVKFSANVWALFTSLDRRYTHVKLESMAKPSVMVALRYLTNAKLLRNIRKFRYQFYHGSRGWFGSSLNDTVTLLDYTKNLTSY